MPNKRSVSESYDPVEFVRHPLTFDTTVDKRYRGDHQFNSEDEDLQLATIDILGSLIAQIGEKSHNSLESNLDDLSRHVIDAIPKFKNKIMSFLAGSILEQPHKVTIYSTLLGLINVKDYEFTQAFLDYLLSALLPRALQSYQLIQSEILVRFLADLVNSNVISTSSLLILFEKFLSVLEETSPRLRKDAYVGLVLKTLPWCGRALNHTRGEELRKMLKRIDKYLNARDTEFCQTLRVWRSATDTLEQEEFFKAYWNQLMNFKKKGFTEKAILRPYLSFHSELSPGRQHKLPSFDLPEYRKEHRAKYGLPRVQFRFFDLHDVSSSELSLPPSDSIERFILEEQVRTILSLDYRHRKDCVRSLLNLSPSGRYPVDYIIMEVTLGELFRLPCPNAKFLFYFSVLLEFSKLPELGFSSLIALSFEMLYEKLEWMEVECRERFSLWFAWHLSNNSYKWHWDDWKNCDRKCEPAQYGFIRSALQKCVKLSYHERIHGVLPEDLHHLMPSAPRPCFELFSLADTEEFASVEGLADSQVHPASPVVRRVFEAVRKKEPSNFIRSLLQEVSREHISINDRYKSVEEFQVYLFTQCLLLAGSKSYSHFISALERYMKLLNEISQLEDCKNQIIYALFSFWESSAQMLAILMDRLVTYRVIDPTSVINCLFSYDFLENHEKLGLWDILTATLNKMVARTDQMKLDIELVEGEISYLEHGKKGEENSESIRVELTERTDRLNKLYSVLGHVSKEQKEAFFTLFQRMLMVLREKNCFYQPVLVHLKMYLRKYQKDIADSMEPMEKLIFSKELDPEIMDAFNASKALLC